MNLEFAKHSGKVEFRVGRVINDPENNQKVYELIASLRTAGDRNLYKNSMRLLEGVPDLFVAVRLIGFFEILDFESDELAVSYLRGELNTLSEKQSNYKTSLQEEMRWICREVVSNCGDY